MQARNLIQVGTVLFKLELHWFPFREAMQKTNAAQKALHESSF